MEDKIFDDVESTRTDTNLINSVQDNLNTLTLEESSSEEVEVEMPRKPVKQKIEKKIETEKKVVTDKQTEMEKEKLLEEAKVINVPIRLLSCHTVPEKIIFCLDTYTDKEYTPFEISDGSTFTPLYMLKRVINIFVENKTFTDSRHEFALVTLDSHDVKWLKDFTNNPGDIINSLKDITECETVNEGFKLSNLLDAIWQNVNIPKPTNDLNAVPPYIVRLILLYNRSNCLPVSDEYEELLNNPYFTIDVIMTHNETPVEKFQEIFNHLQKLDVKGYSYKFEVGRNVTNLHDCMGKILAHPLQRPTQSIASYSVNPV